MKLNQRIVEIRKENNLTQEEFANMFGVTRQTVSNWENGKNYPDLFTLIKISDAFNCSLDSMLKEDYEMVEELDDEIEEDCKKIRRIIVDAVLVIIMAVVLFQFFLSYTSSIKLAIIYTAILLLELLILVLSTWFFGDKLTDFLY